MPCKVGDKYVILVDTPGFNDTERSDTEILYSLAEWMKDSYDEKMLLSGIIYLHSISDARMTNSSLQNLRMFRKLCGDDNLKNVVLVTTKWGITPEEDAHRRERDLTSETGFWGTMIAAGSSVRRFENSTASAKALVEDILYGGERFMPTIQKEVVQGKKLADTEAGAFINKALNELQERYEEEKEVLKQEVKLAQTSGKREHFVGNTIMTPLPRKSKDARSIEEGMPPSRATGGRKRRAAAYLAYELRRSVAESNKKARREGRRTA